MPTKAGFLILTSGFWVVLWIKPFLFALREEKISERHCQLALPSSTQMTTNGENLPAPICGCAQCAIWGHALSEGFPEICFFHLSSISIKRQGTCVKAEVWILKSCQEDAPPNQFKGGFSSFHLDGDDVCWLIYMTSLVYVQWFHQMLYCLQRELQLEFTCRLLKIYLKKENASPKSCKFPFITGNTKSPTNHCCP